MFKNIFPFVILFLLLCVSSLSQTPPSPTVDTIKADMQTVVCKNADRLEAVKQLYKSMGATDDELVVTKFQNVEDLIVTKKGSSDDTVIIGAHYDKVSAGCGAIDNWTGVVIVANLYKYASQFQSTKTLKFVAFGREEEGLIGAAALARSIPKEERPKVCAMVNFDSFGFGYPQVMTNTSDAEMTKLAKTLAGEIKMPFGQAAIDNADADSSAFKDKGIPAITFHGLSDKWQQYLHSSNDKIENVNFNSVLVGFSFARLYLAKIDEGPCNMFRDK